MYEEDDEELEWGPSKSALKREAHAAQALGEALVDLSSQKLAQLPLSDELVRAIKEAQRIKAHGGRRRQLQYIGKLMRVADVESIQQAYDRLMAPQRAEVKLHHALENWRERLLAEGDAAINALLAEAPGADRQRLRQLLRQCHVADEAKAKRGRRQLFSYLTEVLGT